MKTEGLWQLFYAVILATSVVGVAVAGGAPDDLAHDAEFLDRLAAEQEAMCLEGVEPINAFWRDTCAVGLVVSREDLNKDGSYELVVFIAQSYSCGASNCDTHVYEQRDGEWVFLTSGENGLETYDDPDSEWPILIFWGSEGQVWRETAAGGSYRRFCVSDRCRGEQG